MLKIINKKKEYDKSNMPNRMGHNKQYRPVVSTIRQTVDYVPVIDAMQRGIPFPNIS